LSLSPSLNRLTRSLFHVQTTAHRPAVMEPEETASDEERRRGIRRAYNRLNAQRSRQRTKEKIATLVAQVEALEKQEETHLETQTQLNSKLVKLRAENSALRSAMGIPAASYGRQSGADSAGLALVLDSERGTGLSSRSSFETASRLASRRASGGTAPSSLLSLPAAPAVQSMSLGLASLGFPASAAHPYNSSSPWGESASLPPGFLASLLTHQPNYAVEQQLLSAQVAQGDMLLQRQLLGNVPLSPSLDSRLQQDLRTIAMLREGMQLPQQTSSTANSAPFRLDSDPNRAGRLVGYQQQRAGDAIPSVLGRMPRDMGDRKKPPNSSA
jgi:hypothetical protein